MFDISACEIDNLTWHHGITPSHVFGDRCYSKYPWKALSYKRAYETEFTICFALSILVQKSLVPLSIELMIRCRPRWSKILKGRKNNDQRGVIQWYLMTSSTSRQISRVSPGFCRFLDFKEHFPTGRAWNKIPGFFLFSRMCGNPESKGDKWMKPQ